MNRLLKDRLTVLVSAGMIAMLSACGNSGSAGGGSDAGADGADIGPVATLGSTTIVPTDFSFPQVAEANNGFQVTIPEGPLPAFPARRTLATGSGSAVEFGDPVVLSYNMYSWSTGELVESTASFSDPLTVRAGVTEGIPDYLSNSLLGRNIGDRLQIVFHPGMEDLPDYLDNSDAYVVVLDLI